MAFIFVFSGYNMVTAYTTQRKKPQNYTKNRNFKNTRNLAKIDTSKILKCRHKNKKVPFSCENRHLVDDAGVEPATR